MQSFARSAARALDIAYVEPVADDHTIYASPAYVAAEVALGFMMFREANKAFDLLSEHHGNWPAGQRRDFAVASARMLRATIMVGDYHAAVELISDALLAYFSAPSDRARRELRYCRRLVRDRARAATTLPLQTLRGRIEEALRGDLNL